MNKIQVFENKEFGQLRTLDIGGMRWFVGNDVAKALGYTKPANAVSSHVDSEDKTLSLIQGGCSTGAQNTTFINESGLYSLILSSKLPAAKRFKRWVTSEVLPAIHRTGEYRMKPKASAKPALPAEYEYFPKTFRGEPVMTTQDIAHAIDRDVRSVASFVKRSANLFPGTDFKLLTGTLLREFERENPKLSSGHNKLYVIYRSGVEKLFGIWNPKEGAPMLPPPEPEFVDPVNDKAYMKLVDDIEYTMHFMSMLLRRSLKKGSYEDFKKMAVNIQNVGLEVADQAHHFTLWKPERKSNPIGAENALR